jgi:hypothetical protein
MIDLVPTVLIPASTVVGVVFALILWQRVSQVQLTGGSVISDGRGREYLLEEEQRGEDEVRRRGPGARAPGRAICGLAGRPRQRGRRRAPGPRGPQARSGRLRGRPESFWAAAGRVGGRRRAGRQRVPPDSDAPGGPPAAARAQSGTAARPRPLWSAGAAIAGTARAAAAARGAA